MRVDALEAPQIAETALALFDPTGISDERMRSRASLCVRRGQGAFRRRLLDAYRSRCAISDCNVEYTLEAAHINPYRGDDTNNPSNGILLRTDLHTLFDLGPLTLSDIDYFVILGRHLKSGFYKDLSGKKIGVPEKDLQKPSKIALRWHAENIFKP